VKRREFKEDNDDPSVEVFREEKYKESQEKVLREERKNEPIKNYIERIAYQKR
jgi:hypothetical protein